MPPRAPAATLEAEAAAWRRECEGAKEEAADAKEALGQAKADAEEAAKAREKEAAGWKAKSKAHQASVAEALDKAERSEKRMMADAAANAASLARVEGRVKELEGQLESGRPAEQHMFAMAREQAKRDEEVGKLRAQLKSLREMLRESHRVLKHLMKQESLLKEELRVVKTKGQRDDRLNVEYLKNVTVAFLLKVYGDAEDEEHIRLARVLQTLLAFTPEEAAMVGEKITAFENSWWHRTANLLKPLPPEAAGAPDAAAAAPAGGGGAAAAGAAAVVPSSSGAVPSSGASQSSSSWFSWFSGEPAAASITSTSAAAAARRQTIG